MSVGLRDYRGHRVLPEREGRQAKQDLRGNRGPKETQVLLVLRGSPDLRDLLAKPDPRVNPGQEV
ncbi:hypothetical protein, partial [Escherichia coli]|uniref:hypothetical protein n=1 Tax=Escherichia coli TaxID=562 RepID=UPI0023798C01